mmetsp:Transcript_28237/g.28524  ORF Transcript_28237/g.28524 Transcript_28237/m.28524 type:complete len:161 (+) Transcript_28237:55-537(+)
MCQSVIVLSILAFGFIATTSQGFRVRSCVSRLNLNLKSLLNDIPHDELISKSTENNIEIRVDTTYPGETVSNNPESSSWCLCLGMELGLGRIATFALVTGLANEMLTGIPLLEQIGIKSSEDQSQFLVNTVLTGIFTAVMLSLVALKERVSESRRVKRKF